jgi:hypothetical protein
VRSRSSPAAHRKGSHRPYIKSGAYGQIPSPTSQRVDSMTASRQTHRDLLSLHRDSCRLFELSGGGMDREVQKGRGEQQETQYNTSQASQEGHVPIPLGIRPARLNTAPMQHFSTIIGQRNPGVPATSSPSDSPLLKPRRPPTFSSDVEADFSPEMRGHCHWDPLHRSPLDPVANPDLETLQDCRPIPTTVIDWTTPSTRRREYEKIDRSSRGVRGMWRRFAPSWCQSGERRTLFFEEGKGGKEMYEGSVRRFRMDVPDNESHENEKPEVLKRTWTANRLVNDNKHGSREDREKWYSLCIKRNPKD